MKKLVTLGVAVALLASGTAQAKPNPVSGPQARAALVRYSVADGMVAHRVYRCRREAKFSLRCQMAETGWWNDPADGVWAEDAWSVYRCRRDGAGQLHVQWLDFVWVWPKG